MLGSTILVRQLSEVMWLSKMYQIWVLANSFSLAD